LSQPITEYELEPVPGLPERLPAGEELLWQGAPRWQSMARHAFHARKVAFYFAALLLLRLVWELTGGTPLPKALGGAFGLAVPATLAVGLLALLAWLVSRAALFTITSRRVVMRFGVAIPMTINLPFAQIASAALREHGDGTGDIPLTLAAQVRASYLVLWPFVRPWYFSPPQPMLRAVPDAADVARILGSALIAATAAATAPVTAPVTVESAADRIATRIQVDADSATPPPADPAGTAAGTPAQGSADTANPAPPAGTAHQ
jgi:hypothetical protein